ncbi:potassium channel subfamily T member 1-like [Limulus polyphemus]|uniref:Potassium channel subfamily T member 1-like n=1 Tax=Limulus polyphemus TaxID=6850 RepID=A0ABM1SH93_LIMPO|nr:potassium channel subfamily T member 1-like [Limulus polyphemus]
MSNLWFFGRRHKQPAQNRPMTRPDAVAEVERSYVRSHQGNRATSSGHCDYVPPLSPRRSLESRFGHLSQADSLDNVALHIPRVRVEFYVNENTLKEQLQLFFIKNQRSSLRIRIFNLVIKIVLCVLYIIRVALDSGPLKATCYGCPVSNITSGGEGSHDFNTRPNGHINWVAILWVDRPLTLWGIQVALSVICLSEALLLAYLGYKGNIWQQLMSFTLILELVNNVPFIITIFWPPLRNLFIPVFLNCWLAKYALENIVCGYQHFQRAGSLHVNLFESLYFVVVTFSTVGYGDYRPDCFPSQLFMVIMICVALIVLPTQFQDYFVVLLSPCEPDTTTKMILQVPMWAQRVIFIQGSALKDADLTRARMNAAEACFILTGRNYADRSAADQHTILRSWAVRDFAPNVPQYVQIFRPENKVHVAFAEHVVCEDEFKYALLANNCLCPGTSTFVTLLLHTSRGQEGQTSAEEWHRLYGKCSGNEIYHIQLGDSRFFGEYEGKSFSYASFHAHRKYGVALVGIQTDLSGTWPIMLNPGPSYVLKMSDICFYMSITKEENSAFLPSSSGDETKAPSSINEDTSKGLEYEGRMKERRKSENRYFELSPLKSKITLGLGKKRHLEVPKTDGLLGTDGYYPVRGRRPSIAPVPAMFGNDDDSSPNDDDHDDKTNEEEEKYLGIPLTTPVETCGIVKGFPPISPYIGVSPTLCYLLKEKKPTCCLQLAQTCDHCSFRNAKDYNWLNRCIILAADYASNGIYNFIVPLRAHFHSPQTLRPIILLLERRPHPAFLDAISHFPLVYWMQGSIDYLDDLLRAGINLADSVVVVNKESSNSAEEDHLADCNTIVAVQTMFKLFPSVRIITELSQSSNMRFMQFRAHDTYALHLSKMEKREKERGTHISYMFRLPFASGTVFSASMLDTLLYQAFVKDYMITFIRLLLGIDQAPGSGFLSSMRISEEDLWIRTYGRLYQKLCSTTCEVPIGICRTQSSLSDASSLSLELLDSDRAALAADVERQEICNMVRTRMHNLGLPVEDYDNVSEKRDSLSYVMINPSCDLKLQEGDIVYLIRPSPISTKKIFLTRSSIRIQKPKPNDARLQSNSEEHVRDAVSTEAHNHENDLGEQTDGGNIRIPLLGAIGVEITPPPVETANGTVV